MAKAIKSLNVLFTCVGRRVSLVNSFRSAAKKLKTGIRIYGTDKNELSPALQICDKKFVVKATSHPDYIKETLAIVKNNKIDLIVPTVDLDLKSLALNKDKFSKLGCLVLVSSVEVVDICQDKRKTYKYLYQNNFDTPLTVSASVAKKRKRTSWPCFLKPWDGYASRGNAVVANRSELLFYTKKVPNCIVQEFIKGTEYTCDVYVDFDMKVKSVVPRVRLEVRSGEVSKSRIDKNIEIMKKSAELVEHLGAGPGVITLQLIATADGQHKFIEINPRFGGGAPLSIKAGADYPKWILQHLLSKKSNIRFDRFKDKLAMLRYDSEIWL